MVRFMMKNIMKISNEELNTIKILYCDFNTVIKLNYDQLKCDNTVCDLNTVVLYK